MDALFTFFGICIGAFITLLAQYFDRKDKYRMIAIEKRLQAHQDAFYQWYKLKNAIHLQDDDKREEIITEANDYFFKNALYLENETREEFYRTIKRVTFYPSYLENWKSSRQVEEKEKAYKELMENWNAIWELPNIIQNEMKLDPFVVERDKDFSGKKKNGAD